MRPLEEVQAEVLGSMRLLEPEKVHFTEGMGRILAEPVIAPHDVPQWPNSAMDGFAVRSDDVSQPGAVLEILEDVAAGQTASQPVGPDQAIRIMTGAPMPEGANAVVRVEDTAVDNGKVTIRVSAVPDHDVRPAGGDIQKGTTVFDAGTRITPMHVGVLATIGFIEPVVSRRPRVAIMSTGDELQPPETENLAPGMIRDSNRPMLKALLVEAGAEVTDYGRVPDDADALRAAIGRAASETDVIVTSGGVSMGDYDVTKLVLRDEVGIDFMQVAQKPGKPFGFGHIAGVPFFGLPGNPVSVMVSFENFVRPALLTMQGSTSIFRPRILGIAGDDLHGDSAKTEFLRVNVIEHDGAWHASYTGGQASNVLSGAANADALAVLPRGVELIRKGEPVTLALLRSVEARDEIYGG